MLKLSSRSRKNRGSGTSITIRMPTTPTDIKISGCLTRRLLGIDVFSDAIATLPTWIMRAAVCRVRDTKGQDFRDGAVQVFRHLAADVDQLVEGPRHQLVFHDHDAVLATDLSNLLGDESLRPLATTTGAPLAFASYFSATARCVGLVMITSAVGTAAIMRLRDISALRAADLRFDRRVSFRRATFFLDFIARHPEVPPIGNVDTHSPRHRSPTRAPLMVSAALMVAQPTVGSRDSMPNCVSDRNSSMSCLMVR